MSEEGYAALQAFMSSICRDAYAVDWADHLEYALWHALIHGPMRFGRLDLDAAHLDELRRLSELCDGWVTRAEDGVFLRLPRSAWQDRFASNVDLVRMGDPD